jgi:heptosyltransferase-2
MYASGAPVRIGYWHPSNVSTNDAPHQRHNPVLTRVLETQSGLHEVLHNLHLLVQIGLSVRDTSLETWIDETDRRAAERFLDRSGQDPGDRLIVIAPGAATPEKVWPAENYKALIERLHLKTSWKFVIIGGPGEVATGEFLCQGNELWVTNLAGKTTLRQTIAVLELTSLLIGNDSGPSHLAAAAKTPVVQIQSFAKTGEADHVRSPVRFRPWGVASAIIQPAQPLPPCVQACEANHPHCITQVTIDEVELAALRLLQASQPSIQPD